MKPTKRIVWIMLVNCAVVLTASAADPVPNVFVDDTVIVAGEVNANFQALVDQIVALETTIAAQAGQITALETNDATQDTTITAMETDIATLQTYNTTLAGQVTALETNDDTQDTSITSLESSDATQNTSIADLETNDTGQDSQIAANAADLTTIQTVDLPKVTVTERQYWIHTAPGSTMTTRGSNNLLFDINNFTTSGPILLIANNNGASTRWVAQRDITVTVSFTGITDTNGFFRILVDGITRHNEGWSVHGGATTSFELNNTGFFELNLGSTLLRNDVDKVFVNIIAESEFLLSEL